MNTCRALLLTIAASLFAGNAIAVYPDRPIKMIVGWSAGGGTDVVARTVAKHLSSKLDVAVVVENRDGASGMIGTEFVAKAPPDGYTIQYTVADTHSVNPHLFQKIRYDANKDFVPIALLGYNPNVLIVNADTGIKSLPDLIDRAKANPGRVSFGTWGIGSGGHVRMAALGAATKVEFLHVPFKGSGPALQAVMGGQVEAMILPAALAKPQAASGKIRILAVDTPERYELVPDVMTYREQGVPIKLDFWQGLFAPKDTPPAVVETLNKAFNESLNTPEAKADLARLGIVRIVPGDGSPAATRAYLEGEFTRWGEVIRSARISVEQ